MTRLFFLIALVSTVLACAPQPTPAPGGGSGAGGGGAATTTASTSGRRRRDANSACARQTEGLKGRKCDSDCFHIENDIEPVAVAKENLGPLAVSEEVERRELEDMFDSGDDRYDENRGNKSNKTV
ncbi:unnamed protein product [Angiostrongylus costaricensis]|uniref:Secreted protein n=1 Tax=Angiostrongylus costaricensis TaxID=334426 RepID=A0A0R3Q2J2_ANGCS|nr:unnamed protein product [Angiostrongylus costaricensis]